jgi:hypothetical protein
MGEQSQTMLTRTRRGMMLGALVALSVAWLGLALNRLLPPTSWDRLNAIMIGVLAAGFAGGAVAEGSHHFPYADEGDKASYGLGCIGTVVGVTVLWGTALRLRAVAAHARLDWNLSELAAVDTSVWYPLGLSFGLVFSVIRGWA